MNRELYWKNRAKGLRGQGPKPNLITPLVGYTINGFNNRRARRMTARANGYLRRDQDGKSRWYMFRGNPEANKQTVVTNG